MEKQRSMFRKILEKLATMIEPGPAFGGDVEEALWMSSLLAGDANAQVRWTLDGGCPIEWPGCRDACYDLGLIVALPPPQDGEVEVHADRARALLDLVESWSALVVEDVEAPAATVVRDALLLVGVDAPLDRIELRSLVDREVALAWAVSEHLIAADNDLSPVPCPAWVAAWRKS